VTLEEKSGMERIVERVVSQVLEKQIPHLQGELVRRVVEELPAQRDGDGHAPGAGENSAAHLLKAISAIHAGTTQREILRALLDNTVRYSGRAALFVIKAGAATGWQGRGFTKSDDDPIKDFALNVTTGVAERALQSRMVFSGSTTEMDGEFISRFGAPTDDQVVVLPLVLKEKVAALVYADAGTEAGGKMDLPALELLVVAASAWLEVASLRKQAQKETPAEGAAPEKAETAEPVAKAASISDPFAAHAPKHVKPGKVETAAEPEPVSAPSEAEPAPPADAFSTMPPEQADVHRKAQRFARLLVDEIKLYNQAKVAEGRKSKDLYDRLKEDIEKSRATYQKRYGSTVAGSADYFSSELVSSLAEDDSSIMGANFRR
jgi:hypothetical protein